MLQRMPSQPVTRKRERISLKGSLKKLILAGKCKHIKRSDTNLGEMRKESSVKEFEAGPFRLGKKKIGREWVLVGLS